MLSKNKLFLAGFIIIVAISLAGWGIWLWSLKTPTNGNANNTNTANANISNTNAALDANANSQQLNVNSSSIDTSNWQTYRNEELGFEIKYPNDWRIESQDGSAIISCNSEWPNCAWSLTISTTNDELNDFIQKYNKSDLLPNGDALSKIYKQEKLVFSGYPATKLIGTTALGIDNIFIFVSLINKKYVLSYSDVKGESRDAGEKITQTFSITP